ncbi:MAG: C45 family peptidase [Candidatus Eisenbacteria bacterium]
MVPAGGRVGTTERREGRQALEAHMPELVPTYHRLVELMPDDPLVPRALSLYCPTPYLTGCSQAVWGRPPARLIRNYDYSPVLWEGLLLHSSWTGSKVIAMSDCLWGALDGINEHGLAVSLTFGGSREIGPGFGIPLIVRYVLETCRTTQEAVRALTRIPCHMAYNVTALDRAGRYVTVHLAPRVAAVVTDEPVATNHQAVGGWLRYVEASGSIDRKRLLRERVEDGEETEARFLQRFFEPPLFSHRYEGGWGTLYTADYAVREGTARYFWPGQPELVEHVDSFREEERLLRYSDRKAAQERRTIS